MKQGKSLITFVMLIFAGVITLYFGCYIYAAMTEPYRTVQVYAYTAHDSVPADGLVVRQARVLSAPTGILEVTRAEGEKVGVGQQIALVYQNSQAQSDQAVIEELQMEIDLLEDTIAQAGDLESSARLDEDILQAVVSLRASYSRGDCTQLREQVLGVKSSVLKRGYTYGEGLTSEELAARLQGLRSQLAELNRQTARATTQVTAPTPGVFSNLVDGYESRLTPDSLAELTPSALQALIDSPAGEDSQALGKLITSDTWYFVANLPKASAARLEQGDSACLRFSGEMNRDVEMKVDRIGPTEGEVTLVAFSSNRYLTLTTLLRHQTVELIFDSWSGLRVPKEALRLVKFPAQGTEEGSGSQAPEEKMGVYALTNGRSEFKEAEIIHEGGDYYVVRPVGSGRKVLRAGDTVITHGTGLQDGLLIEG